MVFRTGPHGRAVPRSNGYTGGAGDTSVPSAASSARDLDAAEVFATLPISMQVAFEARDINALDAALSALPPEEAERHMSRCIASGLWDPNGAGSGGGEQERRPPAKASRPPPLPPRCPPSAADDSATAEAAALEAQAQMAQGPGERGNGGGGGGRPIRARSVPHRQRRPAERRPRRETCRGQARRRAAKGRPAAAAPPRARPAHGRRQRQRRERGAGVAAAGRSPRAARPPRRRARARARAGAGDAHLAKLDEAERFKSDEARAVAAAREVQRRLQEENALLRKALADANLPLPSGLARPPRRRGRRRRDDGGRAAGRAHVDLRRPRHRRRWSRSASAGFARSDESSSRSLSRCGAFDALDVQALHAALAALPPAEASEYMRRCVASGLWDPTAERCG